MTLRKLKTNNASHLKDKPWATSQLFEITGSDPCLFSCTRIISRSVGPTSVCVIKQSSFT